MNNIKWYEKAQGNTSTMRIIAMMAAITGCAAVLSGIAAMFLRLPESVAMAGIGAGMTGLGELAKAWQARGE